MSGVAAVPPPRDFSRVLIANRGEIALRIVRAARALGLETVAVYTADDAQAPHVSQADRAVLLAAPEGYRSARALIDAARGSGAQAIHPGYGFLAESAGFARQCAVAGLRFIGPSAEAIALMGDKSAARRRMKAAGLEVIPGYDGTDQSDATLEREARRIGAPLMIKACAGGGGRGMRRVDQLDAFGAALTAARAEALAAFGSADVLLERAVDGARHIEVQVLGDAHGTVVSLGERECSIQRRHQKLIEESPSPAIDPVQRTRLGAAAVRALSTIGYEGAGTLEFLLAPDGRLMFMEMNTRLQVEHPVTELTYDIDLVQWQFRIAAGARLSDHPDLPRVHPRGHAIEVRVCAEDPSRGFLPQSGTLVRWVPPKDLRVEHALHDGAVIAPQFDSMIAKLVAHGPDRESACRTMLNALANLQVFGLATNRDFLIACLRHPVFRSGSFDTGFVDAFAPALVCPDQAHRQALLKAAACLLQIGARQETGALLPKLAYPVRLEFEGELYEGRVEREAPGRFAVTLRALTTQVHLEQVNHDDTRASIDGAQLRLGWWPDGDCVWLASDQATVCVRNLSLVASRSNTSASAEAAQTGEVRSPMHARVSRVLVQAGAAVQAGTPLLVLEAMKIEHVVAAPCAGRIDCLEVADGSLVKTGALLLAIEPGDV